MSRQTCGPAFLMAFAAVGPALAEPQTIGPISQSEVLLERLPTSTALVVGAVFASADRANTVPQFSAYIPAIPLAPTMCLRTRSIDGFYLSEYTYAVPQDWSELDLLTFEYPTDYAEIVSDMPGISLAVAAGIGPCDAPGDEIYVGFWNTRDLKDANQILVNLNTAGAQAVTVYLGDDPSAPAQVCDRISGQQVTGFDFSCLLTLPEIIGDRVQMEIQRSYGGTEDQPDFAWLRIVR